jgi:hypothetical protein
MEALQMVVVHDKLDAGDRFTRTWASFDPVEEGEQIGVRADGTPGVASSPDASCSRTRTRARTRSGIT